jgi:hypothetical protein
MKSMKQPEFCTDRPALILSLLVQVPVVAGAAWAALTASSDFVWGLVLLGPFEIVRLVVLFGLASAYQKYLSPGQVLRSFAARVILPLVFFTGVFVFYWGLTFGVASLIEALSRPWIWAAMLVPAALIVVESAIGLLFFRGDARAQAARLGAMAADAKGWFVLALLYFVLVISLFVLAVIVPPIIYLLGMSMLLFPAMYFAGKAIVLTHVYTANFMRTGQRVLTMPWLLQLTSEKDDVDERQAVQEEDKAADERRLALRGEAAARKAI